MTAADREWLAEVVVRAARMASAEELRGPRPGDRPMARWEAARSVVREGLVAVAERARGVLVSEEMFRGTMDPEASGE